MPDLFATLMTSKVSISLHGEYPKAVLSLKAFVHPSWAEVVCPSLLPPLLHPRSPQFFSKDLLKEMG